MVAQVQQLVALGAVISRSGKQAQGGLSTLKSQELIGCPSITFDSLDSCQLFKRRRHAKRTNGYDCRGIFWLGMDFDTGLAAMGGGVGVGVSLLLSCRPQMGGVTRGLDQLLVLHDRFDGTPDVTP